MRFAVAATAVVVLLACASAAAAFEATAQDNMPRPPGGVDIEAVRDDRIRDLEARIARGECARVATRRGRGWCCRRCVHGAGGCVACGVVCVCGCGVCACARCVRVP